MAVKVFCNQCQDFIKDIEPKEIAKLTGQEICEGCLGKNKQAYNDVERIQKEATAAINKLANEFKVKLDETFRKVMK